MVDASKKDDIVLLDQSGRFSRDRVLGLRVDVLPQIQRHVAVALLHQDGPAVHPADNAGLFHRGQITADSRFADKELACHVTDSNRVFLTQHLNDLIMPFIFQHSLPLRISIIEVI